MIESLENRKLFAFNPFVDFNGVLQLNGTADIDQAEIVIEDGWQNENGETAVKVKFNGEYLETPNMFDNDDRIWAIMINCGGGNDKVVLKDYRDAADVTIEVNLGQGEDEFIGYSDFLLGVAVMSDDDPGVSADIDDTYILHRGGFTISDTAGDDTYDIRDMQAGDEVRISDGWGDNKLFCDEGPFDLTGVAGVGDSLDGIVRAYDDPVNPAGYYWLASNGANAVRMTTGL